MSASLMKNMSVCLRVEDDVSMGFFADGGDDVCAAECVCNEGY